jgi:hypothetical protein
MGAAPEYRGRAESVPKVQKPLLEQGSSIQAQGFIDLIFHKFGGESGD